MPSSRFFSVERLFGRLSAVCPGPGTNGEVLVAGVLDTGPVCGGGGVVVDAGGVVDGGGVVVEGGGVFVVYDVDGAGGGEEDEGGGGLLV